MTKVFLFPGQGSQQVGMGEDLFAKFPREVELADSILGYSIERLCRHDPESQLNRTEFTQPALYVVNALTYLDRLQQGAPKPDSVAGHSLGEYNALFAAGVFDFPTGLRLVRKRASLMGRASGGGMAAVVGLRVSRVESLLAQPAFESIDIANLNSRTQVVISGPAERVQASQQPFEDAGARLFMPLKVSAAFHSRAMADAARAFRRFIDPVEFFPPQIPVIANASARPYGPTEIHDLLSRQIDSPVRWSDTMEFLFQQRDPEFEEIGPGNVLAGLVRQNRPVAAQA